MIQLSPESSEKLVELLEAATRYYNAKTEHLQRTDPQTAIGTDMEEAKVFAATWMPHCSSAADLHRKVCEFFDVPKSSFYTWPTVREFYRMDAVREPRVTEGDLGYGEVSL